MGLSGGVSRARSYPHAFDSDQLYNLKTDHEEMTNVAGDPANDKHLREMQRFLKQELRAFPQRPFGEFIPGGNAVPVKSQQDLSKKLQEIAAGFK